MAELQSRLGRKIDYLRISVTDRCSMRCFYCMPKEGIRLAPKEDVLTFEEILRLAKIFASFGVKKIRLTGGEPLTRNGLAYLVQSLVKLEGVREVSLTTNGALLSDYAALLKESGIKRINVSIDTLDESKFEKITGVKMLSSVLQGLKLATRLGFEPIKLNTVIMKGVNYDEMPAFIEFALSNKFILRFIEFMNVTPLWKEEYYISIDKVKHECMKRFKMNRIGRIGSSIAEYYEIESGLIGFINTDENNCRNCNRIRLTSTGELKTCLYEDIGFSVRDLLRNDLSDKEVKDIIFKKIDLKESAYYNNRKTSKLYMSTIGG